MRRLLWAGCTKRWVRAGSSRTPVAWGHAESAIAAFAGEPGATGCPYMSVQLGFAACHGIVEATSRRSIAAARCLRLRLRQSGLLAERNVDLRRRCTLWTQVSGRGGALARLLWRQRLQAGLGSR